MPAQIGTGVTIAFGTNTGFTPRILGMTFDGVERAVIPNHDMSSTHMDKSPGTVTDWKGFSVEFEQDQNEMPEHASGAPIDKVEEQITVQFPLKGAEITLGANLIGSGFIDTVEWPAPFEERMVGSFHVTWAVKPTFSVGS